MLFIDLVEKLGVPFRLPPVGMRHGLSNVMASFWQRCRHNDISLDLGALEDNYSFEFNSGKAALVVGLRALAGIKPELNEVIVPAYTCYSVPASIQHAGLKIVLCDITPNTLQYDYDMLERLIGDKTLCVIVTHLFGLCADVEKVKALADKHGCFVVEDAAQRSIVARPRDRNSTAADMAIYSFGRGKPISVMGGGILVSQKKEIAGHVDQFHKKLLRPGLLNDFKKLIGILVNDLFLSPRLYWVPSNIKWLGLGKTIYPRDISIAKMGLLQIALLNRLLKRVAKIDEVRRKNAMYYRSELEKISIGTNIDIRIDQIYAPVRFPLYTAKEVNKIKEMTLRKALKFGVVRMYPNGLNRVKELESFCCNCHESFNGAAWIASHLLTLPTHVFVTEIQRHRVISLLAKERVV